MKLVVVEDDAHLAFLLGYHLEKRHEVTLFTSALTAVESEAFLTADAIVTDLMMPDMNGLEVLVSASHKNPQAKKILFTAKSHLNEDERRVISSTGAVVLPKPSPIESLLRSLEE